MLVKSWLVVWVDRMKCNRKMCCLFCSGCGFRRRAKRGARRTPSVCRQRQRSAVLRAVSSAYSSAARAPSNRSASWRSRWTSAPRKTSSTWPANVWLSPRRSPRKTGTSSFKFLSTPASNHFITIKLSS